MHEIGKELVYLGIAVVIVTICSIIWPRRRPRSIAERKRYYQERSKNAMRFMMGLFSVLTVGCLIAAVAQLILHPEEAARNSYFGIAGFSATLLAISIGLWLIIKRLQK